MSTYLTDNASISFILINTAIDTPNHWLWNETSPVQILYPCVLLTYLCTKWTPASDWLHSFLLHTIHLIATPETSG